MEDDCGPLFREHTLVLFVSDLFFIEEKEMHQYVYLSTVGLSKKTQSFLSTVTPCGSYESKFILI